jgi:translation initiation factor IF-3
MSFDKFRYQKEKEEKKQRLAQKGKELKGIRITARAAAGDLQVKMKKLIEFLEEGHKVEIMLALRGREKANKDWALKKINGFISQIPVPFQMTLPPKQGGRGFIAQITKK